MRGGDHCLPRPDGRGWAALRKPGRVHLRGPRQCLRVDVLPDPRQLAISNGVSRPGHRSPSPSQNRTGTSRLIRLPSSSHRGIPPLPMHKGPRFTFRKPTKSPCCASNPTSKTLVFASQPANQIIVHVPPKRLQSRSIESTVVVRPATQDWPEHIREIAQRFVAPELQVPATNGLAHCLHRIATDGRREVHIQPSILIDRLSRLECIAEERKLHGWILGRPIDVLTVHDPRFLRMQFESALTEPLPEFP